MGTLLGMFARVGVAVGVAITTTSGCAMSAKLASFLWAQEIAASKVSGSFQATIS